MSANRFGMCIVSPSRVRSLLEKGGDECVNLFFQVDRQFKRFLLTLPPEIASRPTTA